MLNRNSSARTAAQKSSKCPLLFRQAPILAILMLAAGLFTGCSDNERRVHPIIVSKSYSNWYGNPMPKCICRFFTDNGTFDGGVIEDSCNKYNIGDTLNNKK